MSRCQICGSPRERIAAAMCDGCARSYDRMSHRDGSVMEAMVWAAGRARRAAEKRHRELCDLQARAFEQLITKHHDIDIPKPAWGEACQACAQFAPRRF